MRFTRLNLWPKPLARPKLFSCLVEIIEIKQDQSTKNRLALGGHSVLRPSMERTQVRVAAHYWPFLPSKPTHCG